VNNGTCVPYASRQLTLLLDILVGDLLIGVSPVSDSGGNSLRTRNLTDIVKCLAAVVLD
jgi:hypothetical protein